MSIMAICRAADQPRKPGAVTGFFCTICKIELAVGPTGVQAIKAGAKPFCNSCGLKLRDELEKRDLLAGTILTPEAMDTLRAIVEEKAKKASTN